MSCHVMSCHVMSCHVMSCHVMSCHVMSCHVMSRHVTSCQGGEVRFGLGTVSDWTCFGPRCSNMRRCKMSLFAHFSFPFVSGKHLRQSHRIVGLCGPVTRTGCTCMLLFRILLGNVVVSGSRKADRCHVCAEVFLSLRYKTLGLRVGSLDWREGSSTCDLVETWSRDHLLLLVHSDQLCIRLFFFFARSKKSTCTPVNLLFAVGNGSHGVTAASQRGQADRSGICSSFTAG